LALAIAVLAQYDFNPFALFSAVENEIGYSALVPPETAGLVPSLDNISLNIALVLGTAGCRTS
jgi:cation/acetate symporter